MKLKKNWQIGLDAFVNVTKMGKIWRYVNVLKIYFLGGFGSFATKCMKNELNSYINFGIHFTSIRNFTVIVLMRPL